MNKDITIRTACPDDAETILSIYAPYILNTAITFEYDVPSVEEFRNRIVKILKKYPYLVAILDGKIVGYAYAGTFRPRAAYGWCVEMSIYVDQNLRGKGIGKALYSELESRLKAQGVLNLNASITWVDDEHNKYLTRQSPDFHTYLGYKQCAHFHKCGYKFGQWFDMIWMEKMIGDHTGEVVEIKTVMQK